MTQTVYSPWRDWVVSAARLSFALALGACSLAPATEQPTAPANQTAPQAGQQSEPTAVPTRTARPPAATATKAATDSAGQEPDEIFAILGDLTDVVSVKPEGAAKAHQGQFSELLAKGTELTTDGSGRARLLFSDGTTVRMAPSTTLRLTDRTFDDLQNPVVRLGLAVGKIWTILINGELSAETPIGVGSVRGSYVSIEYIIGDPDTLEDDILIITCLEGTCIISNSAGSLALLPGQKATITGQGNAPAGPFPMTIDDIIDWLDNNPEILILLFEGAVPDLALLGGTPIVIELADGTTVVIIVPEPSDNGTGDGGVTLPTAPAPGAVQWSGTVASARPLGWLLVAAGLVVGVAGRNRIRRQ